MMLSHVRRGPDPYAPARNGRGAASSARTMSPLPARSAYTRATPPAGATRAPGCRQAPPPTRAELLDGDHTLAEPKRLRYRLLHVAARIIRTARRTYLRIAERWPWPNVLAADTRYGTTSTSKVATSWPEGPSIRTAISQSPSIEKNSPRAS